MANQSALHIGVINPYALAEVKVGHPIPWRDVPDPRTLLEQVLGHPYDQLFDPKYASPLYPGLKYDAATKAVVRDEADPVFTAKSGEEALASVLRRTGQVQEPRDESATPDGQSPREGARTDVDIPLEALERRKVLVERARLAQATRSAPLVLQRLVNGFNWNDPGRFFTDATNPNDVIQGALADCYFLAALASVAWAHPYSVAQRNRQTAADGLFPTPGAVDLVLFWNTSRSGWDRIEVSELLPLQPPSGNYIYARSDDRNETWSAIYEKAFAMWRTGDTSNFPNYTPINYGDPVAAAISLTGLPGQYFGTNGVAPHDIWQTIRSHCLSFKTFDPMVAWTYSSDAVAPTAINYASASIVANHAYSILGWDYAGSREYVILRNPWGNTEATLNVEGGSWASYNGSFWYPVPLSSHGIFALRADTFQQYFAGYGVVSGTDTIPAF